MAEYRAVFDAAVTFTNGGGLEARGFRIDVPHRDVSEREVGRLWLTSLGLLLAEEPTIENLRIVEEPHRGTRGGPVAATTAGTGTRLVDLSHPIRDGEVTYPGLPGPRIGAHTTRESSRANYAPGVEFEIDRIEMVGNTGTYVDSPFHRYAGGGDLAGLPLERLVDVPAVVIRLSGVGVRAIGVPQLAAYEVRGRAVLLHTGGDAAWATPEYAAQTAFLTRGGAEWLVEQGAAIVGIDGVNIDDIADPERPAHSLLLAAGIPVVEHLTALGEVPTSGATFTALPAPVVGMGTFPVRAIARAPE